MTVAQREKLAPLDLLDHLDRQDNLGLTALQVHLVLLVHKENLEVKDNLGSLDCKGQRVIKESKGQVDRLAAEVQLALLDQVDQKAPKDPQDLEETLGALELLGQEESKVLMVSKDQLVL